MSYFVTVPKYKITVSWTIQGVGFKSTQSRTSAIEEGTEFTVWYNPEDATEFYIEGFDSTPEGTSLMGIIYLLTGIALGTGGWLYRKKVS